MAAESIVVPFGVGELFITDNSATAPQSTYVGGLQELALKITRTSKGFKGAYLFDLLRAITGAEASLTAKFGAFKPTLIGSVLGGSVSAGYRNLVMNEVTASGTSHTVAHSAGMKDKGVCDSTNKPLTRVASGATAGQYSVDEATGTYTFGTSGVYTVCYTWDESTNTGQKVAISNALMAAPTTWFQIDAFNPSEKTGFVFTKALPKSLNLPRKNDDFVVEDLEFDLMPNASGLLGTVYLGV